MEKFLETLLQLSVGGGLMALLLLSLRYLILRKMPSTLYYYLWITVLLRLVLPVPGLWSSPGEDFRPLSDRDLVTAAVKRDPAELQYAKPCFWADYLIVKEALQQVRRSPEDHFAIEFIAEEMTDDKELMLMAVRANPGAYAYVSRRLKKDPDILALPRGASIKEILDLDWEFLWDGMK